MRLLNYSLIIIKYPPSLFLCVRSVCSHILVILLIQIMSQSMTKPTKWPLRQAKTQIRLGICPVWSVFAVRMRKPWILSFPWSAQQRLIRLCGNAGWSESLLSAHHFCWFCHAAAQIVMNVCDINIIQLCSKIRIMEEPWKAILQESSVSTLIYVQFIYTTNENKKKIIFRILIFYIYLTITRLYLIYHFLKIVEKPPYKPYKVESY